MAKDVVKKEEAGLPAEFAAELYGDAATHTSETSTEDMLIPFIKLAHPLGDEMKRAKAAYIPGLEEGDFFNNATQQIWKQADGLPMIPVLYERQYLEWVPVERGGGFRGRHGPEIMAQCNEGENGRQFLPDGNEIVVTGVWYVLIPNMETGDTQQAVVSLAKSQLKQSRKLMTNLKTVALRKPDGKGTFNPPFFYNLVRARSLPTSNEKGDWHLWDFPIVGNVLKDVPNGAEVYAQARALHEAVTSGKVKAAPPEQPMGGGDEEMPF